jgi:MFS family permease
MTICQQALSESGFGAPGTARSSLVAAGDRPAPEVMCPELLERFAEVSDGRCGRGRVHPVAVVLALCAAAVVAGMGSFTAIAGWAADVPVGLLAQLYGRPAAPPSKATIWRVVTGAGAAAVDAVIGAWLAGQAPKRESTSHTAGSESPGLVAIAVDGKTVRGAIDAEGNQVHLLAAATHRVPWYWAKSRPARRPTRSPCSHPCSGWARLPSRLARPAACSNESVGASAR